jgi:hypothetical protein
MTLTKEHIVYTLGIDLSLNESVGYIDRGLVNEIIRRQLIYESFLDSVKNFAKEKWDQAITTIKDWKDAASVLGKIISNPNTLIAFSDNFWKSFKSNNLKRFIGILEKLNLSAFVPKVIALIDKITAMKGWQKFMAGTAIAAITAFILEKIKGFTVQNLSKWLTSYFSDSALSTLTSKLTDFTSYVSWLGPIVQGVGVIYDVLKDHINKFKNSFIKPSNVASEKQNLTIAQTMNENYVLRKKIRNLIIEHYVENGNLDENYIEEGVGKYLAGAALGLGLALGSPGKAMAQDVSKDNVNKPKIVKTLQNLKKSVFDKKIEPEPDEDNSQNNSNAAYDSLKSQVGKVQKTSDGKYSTVEMETFKSMGEQGFASRIAASNAQQAIATAVKGKEVSPGRTVTKSNVSNSQIEERNFQNPDGTYTVFVKVTSSVN